MIVGVDTSVLLRLMTGEPEALAAVALDFLLDCRQAGHRLLVSDWVVAEAYHALQHHYGATKKESLEALAQVLATPGIECQGFAVEVLRLPDLETAKPGFIDRLIHRGYLNGGADQFVTFEKSAAKLKETRVLTS